MFRRGAIGQACRSGRADNLCQVMGMYWHQARQNKDRNSEAVDEQREFDSTGESEVIQYNYTSPNMQP